MKVQRHPQKRQRQLSRKWTPTCQNKTAYAFLAPSLLGLLVFVLLPFADVIRRSFFQAVGGLFVGMDNYRQVLENGAFRQALGLSLIHIWAGEYRYAMADRETIQNLDRKEVPAQVSLITLLKMKEHTLMSVQAQDLTIFVPLFSIQAAALLKKLESSGPAAGTALSTETAPDYAYTRVCLLYTSRCV